MRNPDHPRGLMFAVLRGRVFSLVLAAGLLVLALALAPRADARIYWTTRGGDIGRANLDGSGVDRHFIRGAAVFPSSIAVYGHHIYWTDTTRDTIGRANLDGSGVDRNFISFPPSPSNPFAFRPHDVAVRAGHVYWANWSSYVGRARTDGTHAQLRFIGINTQRFAPGYLAVTNRHLYWTGIAFEEPNAIGRANLDGSGIRNSFISSETSPFNIAAGGGHLYWTTPKTTIVRANLDGSGVRPGFLTPPRGKGQPGGIAVGGGRIYWTSLAHTSADPTEDVLLGWIGSADLGGGRVRWIATGSGEETPTDVAVVSHTQRH